jgi:hypothetical protein
MLPQEADDRVRIAGGLEDHFVGRVQGLCKRAQRLGRRRHAPRLSDLSVLQDGDLSILPMHVQADAAQKASLLTGNWERGGQHDTNGFALAAHPGQSQGRPPTNASSQLIVRTGLPVLRAPECPSPGWSHHNGARQSSQLSGEQALNTFIQDTNAIERAFREVRRRTRPMTCFTNDASCDRITYAVVHYLNAQWQGRPLW